NGATNGATNGVAREDDALPHGLVTAPPYAKPIEPEDLSTWETGRRLLGLVRPEWAELSVTLAAGLAKAGCTIALGVASAWLTSSVAAKFGVAGAYGGLIPVVLGLAVAVGVFTWFESWISHDMAYKLLAEMRIALYRKLDPLAPD